MVHPAPRPGPHILPHMSQNLPATTQGEAPPPARRKRRISAAVRKALRYRVEKGKTWAECAERAGMSESGLYKALNLPHVQELYEAEKTRYTRHIESLEGVHKARALEVARELLEQDENKNVRARMVEFLRGESKKPSVSVTLNQQFNGDYAFAPRGARVVEIVPSDDMSGAQEQEDEQEQ